MFLLFISLILLPFNTLDANMTISKEERPVVNRDFDGVIILITPRNYPAAPEKIELKIMNQSDSPIQFGADYQLERFDFEKLQWEEVFFPEGIAFIQIMYELPAGETQTYEVSLFPDQIKYEAGLYRIKKQIFINNGSKEFYSRFLLD